MALNEQEKDIIIQVQLNNLKNILDAEVNHVICQDHTGHKWRKIEIIYEDESL